MDIDPTILAIGVAIAVVVATIIFFVIRSLRSSANTVLIVGLSDSGKSHIFSKIANKNVDPITYTSFSENVLEVEKDGSPFRVVDFPGAERMRKQLVEKWLGKDRGTLKSIVFVVDSSSFSKRARDVAEFLYEVALESGKKIPTLIACNKQDHSLAKSEKVIRSTLEKELGLINKTRAAALTTTDGSSNRKTLTDSGEDFQWEDLPAKVDFVECSAVGDGLDDLRGWIGM